MIQLTTSQFKDRFVALVLGGREMPKKELDRHVLLVSATLGLETQRWYSEKELNEELRAWSAQFGGNFNLDHVTLRRYLVDEGYLLRDTAGGQYELATSDLPYTLEKSAEKVDLGELVEAARKARELKKSQYMKKSQE